MERIKAQEQLVLTGNEVQEYDLYLEDKKNINKIVKKEIIQEVKQSVKALWFCLGMILTFILFALVDYLMGGSLLK